MLLNDVFISSVSTPAIDSSGNTVLVGANPLIIDIWALGDEYYKCLCRGKSRCIKDTVPRRYITEKHEICDTRNYQVGRFWNRICEQLVFHS